MGLFLPKCPQSGKCQQTFKGVYLKEGHHEYISYKQILAVFRCVLWCYSFLYFRPVGYCSIFDLFTNMAKPQNGTYHASHHVHIRMWYSTRTV